MWREMFILAMSVVLYLPKVFPKTFFFGLGLKMCDKWKILSCACFQVSMLWPSGKHKENFTFDTNIFRRFVITQVFIYCSQISYTFYSYKRRQQVWSSCDQLRGSNNSYCICLWINLIDFLWSNSFPCWMMVHFPISFIYLLLWFLIIL